MNQSGTNNVGAGSQEEMFQAGLETIRIDFKRTLETRLATVRKNMRAIETNEGARDALLAIKASAHKFRGTATTLGFTALGEAAGDLEDCIKDFENPEKDTAQVAQLFLSAYVSFVKEISALVVQA